MGMYTTVLAKVDLMQNTPKELIEILQLMLDQKAIPADMKLPNDEFFKTDWWQSVLGVWSDFADCEDHPERSKLTDNGDGTYTLDIVSVDKHPDSQDKLLEMLAKYSKANVCVGTMQYEEWDKPKRIIFNNRQVYLKEDTKMFGPVEDKITRDLDPTRPKVFVYRKKEFN